MADKVRKPAKMIVGQSIRRRAGRVGWVKKGALEDIQQDFMIFRADGIRILVDKPTYKEHMGSPRALEVVLVPDSKGILR